jgi:hypothetical protein
MLTQIFTDPDLDAKASFQQCPKCIEVIRARHIRLSEAQVAYMQGFDKPLPTLASLQKFVDNAQQRIADGNSSPQLEAQLQRCMDDISTGNYTHPDTPEMEYYDQYVTRLNAFPSVWPDEAELAIRQQEADEILTLLT